VTARRVTAPFLPTIKSEGSFKVTESVDNAVKVEEGFGEASGVNTRASTPGGIAKTTMKPSPSKSVDNGKTE
jgi:hypothetical protein